MNRNVFHPRRSRTLRLSLLLTLLLILALIPANAGQVTAQEAPATAAAPDAAIWQPSGLSTPNALAVDPVLHRVYVTSRSNGKLLVVNGDTGQTISSLAAGDRPWGLSINFATSKVYAADFFWGDIYVYDAISLAFVKKITPMTRNETFLESWNQWVFTVSNWTNELLVIDATKDEVVQTVPLPGSGAWGLAVNRELGLIYVTMRNSQTLLTLKRATSDPLSWQVQGSQTITPCGTAAGDAPYGLTYDPARDYLHVACAHGNSVNEAAIYLATAGGLTSHWRYALGNGGDDGGGGIVVNPATGNAFYTNSAASTVTVLNPGSGVLATVPVGYDPFGAALDPVTNVVLVGNRVANNISLIPDAYAAGLHTPNDVAADPFTGRLYVTNRDTNLLAIFQQGEGGALKLLNRAPVGAQPWGVTLDLNPAAKRVYVANFASDTVSVLDATTLATLNTITVGDQPTLVRFNHKTGKAFVVNHGSNTLQVIDRTSLAVERTIATGAGGAWGLAVDPARNIVFVSHRGAPASGVTGKLVAFDGNAGWAALASVPPYPCASGELYGMDYNPVNDKLYIACAVGGTVNRLVVLERQPSGSWLNRGVLTMPSGGANGGGGVAANPATGHVFFTNSAAGTVTVVNAAQQILTTLAIGADPFGAAIDPASGYAYIVLRGAHNLARQFDGWSPDYAAPGITLSQDSGCSGLGIRVNGQNFMPANLGTAQIYVDGILLATPAVASGAFTGYPTLPTAGGQKKLIAALSGAPTVLATAPLRTPRLDSPIVFLHGGGGGAITAKSTFSLEVEKDPTQLKYDTKWFTYNKGDVVWIDKVGLEHSNGFLEWESRYFDALLLDRDGLAPLKDRHGTAPDLEVLRPLEKVIFPTVSGWGWTYIEQQIYGGLFDFLEAIGYREGVNFFPFAYDWRKDLSLPEDALERTIIHALHASGGKKVTILAHSAGGIVTRNYVVKRGTRYVDQVITMGTPYLGIPKYFKGIEVGDDSGIGFHLGSVGVGMDPAEIKKLMQNWGGLYSMLPPPEWYTVYPYEGRLNPNWLWNANARQYMDYNGVLNAMRQRHNATLMNTADTELLSQRLGDMSYLTDQYFAQRIAGTFGWWTTVWTPREMDFGTRQLCFGIPPLIICGDPKEFLEVVSYTNVGDDTVLVRSAIGGNLPAWDDRYYCVDGVRHGDLPNDWGVQGDLLMGMLAGEVCSNSQVSGYDCPAPEDRAGEVSSAPTAATSAAGNESPPLISEVRLFGDAELHIYDSAGGHAGKTIGASSAVENNAAGVFMARNGATYQALISAAGTYTVAVRGAGEGGAYLRLSDRVGDDIADAAVYPGFAVTAGTAATLTLTLPGLPPSVAMQYQPTAGAPVETQDANMLTGTAANDMTPPAVAVGIDPTSRQVTIVAGDGEGGSGIAEILYSTVAPPAPYSAYTAPFTLPAGTGCVYAVAIDNAGNSSAPATGCLYHLPLILKGL